MKRVFHTISSVVKKACTAVFLLNFVFSPILSNSFLSPNFKALFVPTIAEAAFNQQINYQGKLTDTSNVSVSNGSYNMEFVLYTSRTGGSPIWTETWCKGSSCSGSGVDSRITVFDGLFSVMLGSTTPFTNVDFNQPLYLGVNIGGNASTPTWDGEMSPRKILGTVPSAFEASRLNGLNDTQFVRTDTNNSTSTASTFITLTQAGAGNILNLVGQNSASVFTALSSGNVGIGTTTPGQKLSVAGDILGNNIIGSYFTATSSTATSTFAANVQIGSKSNLKNLTFPSQETSTTNWNIRAGTITNLGTGPTLDQAFGIGYNLDFASSTEPRWYQQFESNWNPSGSIHLAEWYLQFATTTDFAFRPIMVQVDRDTYRNTWNIRGNIALLPSDPASTTPALITDEFGRVQMGGSIGAQQVTVFGNTGTSPSINTSNPVGGSLTLADSDASSGSGGLLTFSAGSSYLQFAGIKGGLTNGSGNGVGDIIFTSRRNASDSTLSESFRIINDGSLDFSNASTTNYLTISNASTTVTTGGDLGGFAVLTRDASTIPNKTVMSINAVAENAYTGTDSAATSMIFKLHPNGSAATEVMRLTSAGKLGIGTTTPGQKLSVAGDILGNNIIGSYFTATSSTATSTFAGGITSSLTTDATGAGLVGSALFSGGIASAKNIVSGTGFWRYKSANGSTASPVTDLIAGWTNNNGAQNGAGIYALNSLTSNSAVWLQFKTNVSAGTLTTAMTIDANQLVGIGSTTPYAQLSVTNTGTNPSFVVEDSTSPDTTPFIIDSSGNVGIGNSTPGTNLDVWGNIRTTYTANSAYYGQLTNVDGNMRAYSNGSGAALLLGSTAVGDTLATERVRITANGNVGIGTSTPGQKLSVAGDILGNNIIGSYFTATSTIATSTFLGGATFATGGGNVGVGTTSPMGKLHLEGDFTSSPALAIYDNDTVKSLNDSFGKIRWKSNEASITTNTIGYGELDLVSNANGSDASFMFRLADFNDATFTDVLSIYGASGLVGIGSSTPYAQLSVTNVNSRPSFVVEDSTSPDTTPFIIDASGNVGVGTVSPTTLLDIRVPAGGTIDGFTIGGNSSIITDIPVLRFKGTAAVTARLGVDNSVGNTVLNTGGYFAIGTNSATLAANERLRILTGGNVGIGTTTPGQMLSVAGDILGNNIIGSYFTATSTTATSTFLGGATFATGGGNVGIGTTTPYALLSVAGSVAFTNTGTGAGTAYVCSTIASGLLSTSTTACNPSSARFKDNIQNLVADRGLATVMSMRPVTYTYKSDMRIPGAQVGFIAEEMAGLVPEAVGFDAEGLPSNIDYGKLTPILTKAIQEVASTTASLLASVKAQEVKFESLETRVARLEVIGGTGSTSVSASISSASIGASIADYLSSMGVQLSVAVSRFRNALAESLTVGTPERPSGITLYDDVTKQPYCLKISAGVPVSVPGECVAVSASGLSGDTGTSTTTTASSTSPMTGDTIAPVITINGNNPANVLRGASYVDLGATVTDAVTQNLGITVVGDQIDTTLAGEYVVRYSATDAAGNTASTTRTVIVSDAAAPNTMLNVSTTSEPTATSTDPVTP